MLMHLEEESEKKAVDNVIKTPLTYLNYPGIIEEVGENNSIKTLSSEKKISKWQIIKDSNHRIAPLQSKGEIKLTSIIHELQKLAIEEKNEKPETMSRNNFNDWIKISRQHMSHLLAHERFHYFIIILVIIDLMVVLIDLVLAQLSSPCLTEDEMQAFNTTIQRDACLLPHSKDLFRGELFLFYFSLFLLVIFVSEIIISFYTFGWRHYTNLLYLSDGIIVLSSFIMELYFHYGNIGRAGRAAAAIVILRLWKIVRAIHAVAHSITVKNRLLIKKIQEAQIIIEDEKSTTEQMLEKQEIKVEYLMHLLKTTGKSPILEQIDNYVDKTWQQRKKNNLIV